MNASTASLSSFQTHGLKTRNDWPVPIGHTPLPHLRLRDQDQAFNMGVKAKADHLTGSTVRPKRHQALITDVFAVHDTGVVRKAQGLERAIGLSTDLTRTLPAAKGNVCDEIERLSWHRMDAHFPSKKLLTHHGA